MKTVTVFGGSGFVGRYVVEELLKAGWRVQVAVRHPLEAKFLRPLGNLGQILTVDASIADYERVLHVIKGSDAVINLVGILYERGPQTFQNIHVQGADNVALACKNLSIKRLVHMSALGASTDSASIYARSKGEGEQHVKKHFSNATIIRPSVIFGPEDGFFNRFASMARFSPFLPLVGGGKTKFQPVYVCDVAEFIVKCLENPTTKSKAYELGGPEVFSMKDILVYTLKTIEKKRLLLPLPFSMARIIGFFAQYLPNPPITPDQVTLLKSDNILPQRCKGLNELSVHPTPLEIVVPRYLARYR